MSTAQPQSRPRIFPRFWDLRTWRLGPKLQIAFLLVGLGPLAVTAFIAIRSSRDAMLSIGTSDLVAASKETADAVDEYLSVRREDIVGASRLPDVINYAADPQNATAEQNAVQGLVTVAQRNQYESVAIVNPDGKIVLSSDDADLNADVRTLPYFTQALQGTVGYIGDPSISTVTGRPAIFFSAPVFDARGKTLAVVLSRLNLSGIGGLIDRDLDIAGPGTFGTLLDQDGIRIARSQSEENRAASGVTLLFHAVAPIPDPTTLQFVADRRFGTGSTSSVTISPLPEVAAALSNPSIKTFETSADYSTERHFAAVAALSSKPWHYVLMTPVSTFTGNADFEARLFGVLALLVALGTIVGVTIISRNFTRPIAQLTSVADRISLGELDAQIDIHRQDEIGDLADSLSRMQTSLQAAVERLRARRSSG